MALPLPKYEPQAPHRRRHRRASRSTQTPLTVQPAQVLDFAPRPTRSPAWLRGLKLVKTVVAGAALLATVGSLVVYVDAVKSQQEWRDLYSRMAKLRREEPDLKIIAESFDNSFREQAQRENMVPVTPDRIIHLPSSSTNSSIEFHPEPEEPIEFPAGY